MKIRLAVIMLLGEPKSTVLCVQVKLIDSQSEETLVFTVDRWLVRDKDDINYVIISMFR